MDEWLREDFAKAYADKNDSSVWYENEINTPALIRLLPAAPGPILDLGCGPGHLTAQLSREYTMVGADISPAMIHIARERYATAKFIVWDGASKYPGNEKFACVLSKLTLMFVQDLGGLSRRLKEVLLPRGTVVFSVPHPFRTAAKTDGNYFMMRPYAEEIGDSGLRTTMIHRSIQAYTDPFLKHGFVIDKLVEPSIPENEIDKRLVDKEFTEFPRRLIVRLVSSV